LKITQFDLSGGSCTCETCPSKSETTAPVSIAGSGDGTTCPISSDWKFKDLPHCDYKSEKHSYNDATIDINGFKELEGFCAGYTN